MGKTDPRDRQIRFLMAVLESQEGNPTVDYEKLAQRMDWKNSRVASSEYSRLKSTLRSTGVGSSSKRPRPPSGASNKKIQKPLSPEQQQEKVREKLRAMGELPDFSNCNPWGFGEGVDDDEEQDHTATEGQEGGTVVKQEQVHRTESGQETNMFTSRGDTEGSGAPITTSSPNPVKGKGKEREVEVKKESIKPVEIIQIDDNEEGVVKIKTEIKRERDVWVW